MANLLAAGAASDPAAFLMNMIETCRPKRRYSMAMAWAYFDETGDFERLPDGRTRFTNMIFGGCLAGQEAWNEFNAKWAKALSDEKVPSFHAKNFFSYNKPFRWFTSDGKKDEARHAAFRDRLGNIILDHVDEIFGFSNDAPDGSKRPQRDAYEKGVVDALKQFRQFRDEAVYMVIARHPEMSPWRILRHFEHVDWEGRLAGCAVFSPDEVMPLQAADYVLHAINQRWRNNTDNPTFALLRDGAKQRNISFKVYIGARFTAFQKPPDGGGGAQDGEG